jgi:hypothetical protein
MENQHEHPDNRTAVPVLIEPVLLCLAQKLLLHPVRRRGGLGRPRLHGCQERGSARRGPACRLSSLGRTREPYRCATDWRLGSEQDPIAQLRRERDNRARSRCRVGPQHECGPRGLRHLGRAGGSVPAGDRGPALENQWRAMDDAVFVKTSAASGAIGITTVAPYAAFGAFYFLVSAIWLTVSDARRRAPEPRDARLFSPRRRARPPQD